MVSLRRVRRRMGRVAAAFYRRCMGGMSRGFWGRLVLCWPFGRLRSGRGVAFRCGLCVRGCRMFWHGLASRLLFRTLRRRLWCRFSRVLGRGRSVGSGFAGSTMCRRRFWRWRSFRSCRRRFCRWCGMTGRGSLRCCRRGPRCRSGAFRRPLGGGRPARCVFAATAQSRSRGRRRGHVWTAVIHRRQHRSISTRGPLMRHLRSGHRHVSLMRCGQLLGGGPCVHAVWPAVIADPPCSSRVRHSCAVHVVNHRSVHVGHFRVVIILIAPPIAAVESGARIAKSVIDAAVKAHRDAPVAGVPKINTTRVAPIARRPKQTNRRRQYPGAWHPVVTADAPSPVTRLPDITDTRTNRLRVDRKNGWSNGNGDRYISSVPGRTGFDRSGNEQECTTQNKRADPIGDAHITHLSKLAGICYFCVAMGTLSRRKRISSLSRLHPPARSVLSVQPCSTRASCGPSGEQKKHARIQRLAEKIQNNGDTRSA